MITLHILKLLEDEGFGTLALTGNEPNASLFFEKLPLDKTGVFIMSRGAPLVKGTRITQSFDLYARGTNDIEGANRLNEMLDYFRDEGEAICDLPTIPGYSDIEYKNVHITPTGSIENAGSDDTDRVIYVVSAEIRYNRL
jgi:hypothetical protein